ncbi:PfkB family carbohydrate kinase [Halobacillus litoralis]|uniref:PfkB family carbohydrate kinase n=1 Tax=Halobacillus litoralis TaxID=45668 RepID=UPI001CD2C41C|nr:PfkB family carbohydrate kinase [Halobacillus litoralis]MCA1022900.1 PfkB family carbohydrate kinase [Halobacillus litoralis]
MEKLTSRERQVYQQIVKNPYVSQQTLSEALQLSRSTVANIISGLVQKNVLLGRAYVLNKSRQVLCIGGANVDRKLHTHEPLQMYTSNPVYSRSSAGGVARNIAENLGRLGFHPSLITAAGMDADWDIIEKASGSFINLDGVLHLPHATTGTYTALMNPHGELLTALADMEVFEAILPPLVMKSETKMRQSECMIADLNCPKETLELLLRMSRSFSVPLVFVTVSAPKMKRLPKDLRGLTWLMTNIEETEAHFHMSIDSKEKWCLAAGLWLEMGIEKVTITSGKDGVVVGENEGGIHHFPSFSTGDVNDVTGAGDAFCSGVLYGWMEGMELREVMKTGMMNAVKCIQSPYTVRQDLTPSLLTQDVEELV